MPARPLCILQVLRAPVGGLFRHVADLARELAARGHSVGIVVDNLANDSQTEALLRALEPIAALGIHRFPMPRLFGAGDLKTPFAVSRLARRLDVDIIHGHGAKGGFYARLALYGRTRAKAFYTPHGGVLHYKADSRSGQLFHRIERHLMAKTSAIIFESAYAGKTYSTLIGDPSCRAEIIHNGLRPDEFVPVLAGADAADFVFVGELRTLKGIFPLVEALAMLQGATLVMAGDGPERAALDARIEALGLTQRVRLVGSQPARQVFAMGRCAVIPSLAESLPYVVLEAAAAQLPVIATRVGGIPEIFGPTSAQLLPPGDAPALAEAMQRFLDNPAAAGTDMLTRLDHIKAGFSVRRMTDAIEALYRSA
ncbi:glycosyltransferase family 4 protein [Devosia faecipullorum]|uniref:glycosyltransferase family 4 protein n=1 Tax=Devosia faecipullorum TaxID=2755039 RepID=UPI00187BA3F2|nr:glycosyltransferase family 4 protein [Devosia faecipullorum]MBE7731476.1 glycosyltransferase family 4 protein [Devosia faecipullorum]